MFDTQIYVQRREHLKQQLSSGSLLFPGNNESPMNYPDNAYRFRQLCSFLQQNSNLFRVTTFKEILNRGLLPDTVPALQEIPNSRTTNYLIRGFQNLSSTVLKY